MRKSFVGEARQKAIETYSHFVEEIHTVCGMSKSSVGFENPEVAISGGNNTVAIELLEL